jgi:hypothetical protein
MLSSVLRSERAVQVNIEVMRAFVRLRRILASHADLARKLESLEKKYDVQLRKGSKDTLCGIWVNEHLARLPAPPSVY